jgi:DNA-binding NtrC family response regulator
MKANTSRPRVRLVGEDVLLIESLWLTLKAVFEIDSASSEAEAVAVLAVRTLGVIISDHMMPHGMGLEMPVSVRERYLRMKRLMMNG